MDPSSFHNECAAPAQCSSGATSSGNSKSRHLVVDPDINNRCGSSCASPFKATALAERSEVPRQPFSSNTRASEGCGLLELYASLHNASQPSGTNMSSKMREVFSFADGECSTDGKCSSPLFGDHLMSTQVFNARNDKKHGGRDKTDHTGTCTSETSKPLGKTGCSLQSDVRPLNAEMPTVCGTKESFSTEFKCLQKSNFKTNKAPLKESTEPLSYTNVPVPLKSSTPAANETSVLPVPEVYIDGLPESKAEDKNAVMKVETPRIVANDLTAPQFLTVLEDSQVVRDTSTEVCVSSVQVPPSVQLAECDMPSEIVKSMPAATAATPPAGSLGAGAGARPKTGSLRVVPARTKTRKEENMQLCEPREPRPRCLTSMNSHMRPSRRGSASTDSSRAASEFSAALLQHENFLKESCSSSEEQSTSTQQVKQNNGKQFDASKASRKKSFALKLSGLEPGGSTPHPSEFRPYNKEHIDLKSFRTDVAKSSISFSERLELQEVQYSNILWSIEENHGSPRDSMEEMEDAQQEVAQKRPTVELQQYKTTKRQAEYYGQVTHHREEIMADLDLQFKEKNGFERKKQKDPLRECKEEKLRSEAPAMKVEPLVRRCKREMRKIQANLQELRDRLIREGAEIARMRAQVVLLEMEDGVIRERSHGG